MDMLGKKGFNGGAQSRAVTWTEAFVNRADRATAVDQKGRRHGIHSESLGAGLVVAKRDRESHMMSGKELLSVSRLLIHVDRDNL